MKPTLFSCLLAAVLATPAVAFSQSVVTRAQVRDQFVTFESAAAPGTAGDAHYPDAVLAAAGRGARPATAATAALAFGGHGGVAAGSSEAGRRAPRTVSGDVDDVPGFKPVYFGQ